VVSDVTSVNDVTMGNDNVSVICGKDSTDIKVAELIDSPESFYNIL
jgi:hypothetical protein